MTIKVLSKDLPRKDMDGDNDPPNINSESYYFDDSCRCRHILSSNNSPFHHRRVLPSEKLGTSAASSSGPITSTGTLNCFRSPKVVHCYVYQYVFTNMVLNFFILPRISRSGVGTIKVQKKKRDMEAGQDKMLLQCFSIGKRKK